MCDLYYIHLMIRINARGVKRINVNLLCVCVAAIFNNCSIDKSNLMSKDDIRWQMFSDTSFITAGTDVNTIVIISQGERIRRYGIRDVRYVNTVYSRLKVKNIYGESYLKYEVSKCNGNITFNLTQNGNVANCRNINDSVICFTFNPIDTLGSRIRNLYIQKGVGVINCTTND